MNGSPTDMGTQITVSNATVFSNSISTHWGDFSNGTCTTTCADQDNDNICDTEDNCPTIANENQTDADSDNIGAACDCDDSAETGPTCFENCTTFYEDQDGDGYGNPLVSVMTCVAPNGFVANALDNCPNDINKTESGDCGCGTPETDCNEVDCSINLQIIAAINEDSLVKGRSIVADNLIASGTNVFFKAGESISLKEGFHAVAGSSLSLIHI